MDELVEVCTSGGAEWETLYDPDYDWLKKPKNILVPGVQRKFS